MVDCFPSSVYQGQSSTKRDELLDFPYGSWMMESHRGAYVKSYLTTDRSDDDWGYDGSIFQYEEILFE